MLLNHSSVWNFYPFILWGNDEKDRKKGMEENDDSVIEGMK